MFPEISNGFFFFGPLIKHLWSHYHQLFLRLFLFLILITLKFSHNFLVFIFFCSLLFIFSILRCLFLNGLLSNDVSFLWLGRFCHLPSLFNGKENIFDFFLMAPELESYTLARMAYSWFSKSIFNLFQNIFLLWILYTLFLDEHHHQHYFQIYIIQRKSNQISFYD